MKQKKILSQIALHRNKRFAYRFQFETRQQVNMKWNEKVRIIQVQYFNIHFLFANIGAVNQTEPQCIVCAECNCIHLTGHKIANGILTTNPNKLRIEK